LEESLQRLSEIHKWADHYEAVRQNPKKCEVWPPKEGSFRGVVWE